RRRPGECRVDARQEALPPTARDPAADPVRRRAEHEQIGAPDDVLGLRGEAVDEALIRRHGGTIAEAALRTQAPAAGVWMGHREAALWRRLRPCRTARPGPRGR